MNKKLFKQIRNEWYSNLWLVIELLFISVVLWYIVDFMYAQTWTYVQPLGFDISHCYRLEMNKTTADVSDCKSDNYIKNNVKKIINNLSKRSDIEAVSLSDNYPYKQNFPATVSYGKYSFVAMVNDATPDYFRVFRCRGANEETPEQLSKMLKDNGAIIPDNAFDEKVPFKTTDLIGKNIQIKIFNYNTSGKVLGVCRCIRNGEFCSTRYSKTIIGKLDEKDLSSLAYLCVRVKAEQDKDFVEKLWKDIDKINGSKVFISRITPMSSYRQIYLESTFMAIKYFVFFTVFLLLNIFLAIFGTFWYRTQQRHSEIAIFKALGANNRNIFMREISESIILLSIATIPAIIIDWNMAFAKLNTPIDEEFLTAGKFITTIVITWLLMAIILILGSWFPARKAMKIQPAVALHED